MLLASLAVARAQGWRTTSDRGHHAAALEGAAQAIGLGEVQYDALDTLRDWRNRKYRPGQQSTTDEAEEAVALIEPFLGVVATWLGSTHAKLLNQGLTRTVPPPR